MKFFTAILFAILSITAMGASTRSLSGDDWKNPLRTKTWTPPSATDTLVGRASTDTLTNKTISGLVNTLTNITATVNANLTGDVTSIGNATTLGNAPVIAKVLTGFSPGAGTVSSSDSLLQAIQKLDGNDALKFAKSTLTTKGDIPIATASSVITRLPVGADNKVLTADSTSSNGLSYKKINSVLDAVVQFNGKEDISTWSKGNNATVLGGGSFVGTYAKETSTPLNGEASYKFTQSSSLNDYTCSPAFTVDPRYNSQTAYLSFPYTYNGSTGDIQVSLYDATNSVFIPLNNVSDVLASTSISTAIYSTTIPPTTASARFCYQVKVANSGKIFHFADVQLSTSLYPTANLNSDTGWVSYTPTTPNSSFAATPTGITVNTDECKWRKSGPNLQVKCKFVSSTTSSSEAQISLPSGLTSAGTTDLPTIKIAGNYYKNNSNVNTHAKVLIEPSKTYFTFSGLILTNAVSPITKSTGSSIGTSGEIESFDAEIPIAGWDAGNTSVVAPIQQVSSDTMAFVFKSTAIASTDPIGTFNTYTYASSSNTATIGGSAPTQTTASMNTDGIKVFGRAFNATSTTGNPARVDIYIGKNLKNNKVLGYASAAKAAASGFSYDRFVYGTATEMGTSVFYNETSGILSLNAAIDFSGSIATRYVDNGEFSLASGYFVFNASATPSIAALPILQPKIATISDVKSSGTQGGASTTTTFVTRTLNTLVDTYGIVTSLSSNQFTLPAGTYYIEASAPAFLSNAHRIRVRNMTDSTTALLGTAEYANAGGNGYTRSYATGEITITTSKVFEIQHYVVAGLATNGLGNAVSSGESEVYATVKIQKIR